MDEVKWYENNSLESIKNIIKDNINTASRSFLAIGYYLKNVRDRKLYQQDGYQDIWEFAHAEFGISQSWASRYMSINDRFSKDGNSPMIQEEFQGFDKSKLSEMLTLTDEQLKQVAITTTVAQIKDIKKSYATSHKTESEEKPVFSIQGEPSLPRPSYLECPSYNFNGMPGRGCSGCVSDQVEHGCAYDRTRYLEEIKRQEDWLVHCEVLKAMCDSICIQSSYILETNNYSMETIRGLSRGLIEFSFGFGDDGTGHSKYDAQYRAERYYVEEFQGTGKWIFEAGEVDQHIWNFNGRDWKAIQHEPDDSDKIVDDTTEFTDDSINSANAETEPIIKFDFWAGKPVVKECAGCKYNIMPREDYFKEYPNTDEFPCDNCNGDLNNWRPDTGIVTPDKTDQTTEVVEAEVIQGDEIVLDCYNDEEGWHKEIIQSSLEDELDDEPEDEELGNMAELLIAKELLRKKQSDLKAWSEATKDNRNSSDVRNINKLKVEIGAMASYICDLDNIVNPIPKPVQPELPILKNNDQRKEFIDAYTSWPVWIDQDLTGERYYRYDFEDGTSFVIRVSLQHAYKGYERTAEIKHGHEEYFLLGVKNRWIPGMPTFTESSTNKSAMIDHLKEIQKKGAKT